MDGSMDAPTDPRLVGDTDDALAPTQAAPAGMPFTVLFPDDDGFAAADLEHPAHLPRVGDRVEYIDERGALHGYLVDAVIHTLQAGQAGRPSVSEGDFTPAALALPQHAEAETPGRGGSLRAGLPRVVLARASDAPEPAAPVEEES
jgi:hypothetical protein